MKTGPRPKTVIDRFWKHVKKSNKCWEWTAGTYKCGYGQIGIGSRTDGNRTKAAVHRVSWEIHNGEIPSDLFVCHRCNNKLCVRPDHLYLGDNTQNMRDASRDGLLKRKPGNHSGTKNAAAKVNEEIVLEIRRRYAKENVSQESLGKQYGLYQTKISSIVNRKTWKHI